MHLVQGLRAAAEVARNCDLRSQGLLCAPIRMQNAVRAPETRAAATAHTPGKSILAPNRPWAKAVATRLATDRIPASISPAQQTRKQPHLSCMMQWPISKASAHVDDNTWCATKQRGSVHGMLDFDLPWTCRSSILTRKSLCRCMMGKCKTSSPLCMGQAFSIIYTVQQHFPH